MHCTVPGCFATLSKANRTGVCRKHNHYAGHCQCQQCSGGKWRGKKPSFKLHAWGGRSPLHKLQQAKADEAAAKKPVTLPKAPWEDRE